MFYRYSVTKVGNYFLKNRITDYSGLVLEVMAQGSKSDYTRFATGGHDIFLTCPAKSMHREPCPSGSRCMLLAGQSPSGSRCMLLAGQVGKISYLMTAMLIMGSYFSCLTARAVCRAV